MSQELRAEIAQIVKNLREKEGFTRENLSLMLGYDNSYISKLEKKKVNVTIDCIDKIAEIFNAKIKISIEQNK